MYITWGHDDCVQSVLEDDKPQLEVVDGNIDGQFSNNIDWSRVGGVYVARPGQWWAGEEEMLKYVPGIHTLPDRPILLLIKATF